QDRIRPCRAALAATATVQAARHPAATRSDHLAPESAGTNRVNAARAAANPSGSICVDATPSQRAGNGPRAGFIPEATWSRSESIIEQRSNRLLLPRLRIERSASTGRAQEKGAAIWQLQIAAVGPLRSVLGLIAVHENLLAYGKDFLREPAPKQ